MSTSFHTSRDIIIRTKKYSEALKFYRSVLGLRLTHKSRKITGFETGSFCLYVEKGKDHGPVFEFLVKDVAAARQKLVAAGCTVIEADPALPRCYVKDPYGMVFNLGQAPND